MAVVLPSLLPNDFMFSSLVCCVVCRYFDLSEICFDDTDRRLVLLVVFEWVFVRCVQRSSMKRLERGAWLFYYTDGKMKWNKEVTGRGKEYPGRRGTLINKKNETDGS